MSASHPSEAEGRTPTCIVERIDDRTLRCQTHNVCWQDTEVPPPSCATTTWMTPEYKARADAIRLAARSPAPSDDCGLEQWIERKTGHLLGEDSLRELDAIVAKIRAPSVEARDADDLLNRFHSVCDGLREYAESGYPKNAQARYDAVRAELRALLPPETT